MEQALDLVGVIGAHVPEHHELVGLDAAASEPEIRARVGGLHIDEGTILPTACVAQHHVASPAIGPPRGSTAHRFYAAPTQHLAHESHHMALALSARAEIDNVFSQIDWHR